LGKESQVLRPDTGTPVETSLVSPPVFASMAYTLLIIDEFIEEISM
jgi:hypothetical protein